MMKKASVSSAGNRFEGSQVSHGLAVRNVNRFQGHAEVRGGQWGAANDRDLPARACCGCL
jgi:hypothetical protein